MYVTFYTHGSIRVYLEHISDRKKWIGIGMSMKIYEIQNGRYDFKILSNSSSICMVYERFISDLKNKMS